MLSRENLLATGMPVSLGRVVISPYHYGVVMAPEIPRAEQPRFRPGSLAGARRRWAVAGTVIASTVLIALPAVAVAVPGAAMGGPAVPDAPGGLQVNLVTSPMAVPPSGVSFSWVTRDSRPGEQQGGYEIRVAGTPSAAMSGSANWDSGMVAASAPYGSYHGPGLAAASRYWWTVRTFDAEGDAGAWAVPAQFGTALSSWSARAIWSAPAGGKNSGWAFLRGAITVASKPVLAATVYAAGASTAPAHQWVYRLSLNGKVLGVGPTPSPDQSTTTEYNSWDVTSLLSPGSAAAFGALAYTQLDQQFVLEVVIQYLDGSRVTWGTGPGWRAMDGGSVYPPAGSVGTAYYSAPVEDLNAARYPWGFDTPSFDPAGWSAPVIKAQIGGLTPLPTANVQLAQHFARSVTKLGTGHYLIDFGATQVGGLRLDLAGPAGRKVTIRYGEVLATPASVRYHLSTGNVFQDVYTLRGGPQTLLVWGFRVFRYVEVMGSPQDMTRDPGHTVSATALVYPDQPGLSSMTSSNPALNAVWAFTKSSVEALNLYAYLDPARERTTNTEGDNYIHQQSQAVIGGDYAEARYSTLLALAFMNGDPQSITEYRQLAPVAALDSWQRTGDPSALAGMYSHLQRMLLPVASNGLVSQPITALIRRMARSGQPGQPAPDIPHASGVGFASPLTIIRAGVPTALVDWPPNERDGFVFRSQNTVVNAFAYAAYHAMAQIAAQLGKTADASGYAARAAAIRSAIAALLYDPASGAFYDGAGTSHEALQSSVYTVALGAAGPVASQTAARFIASHGITSGACSVYCAAYYLEALYDGGQGQAALNMLTASTRTSYRYMMAQGAGSTMEAWNPAIKGNLSYSHAWATSPDFVIPEFLFGITGTTPGWGHLLIQPQVANLASGSVAMPTARGPVKVSFTHPAGGRFTLTVTLPATVQAQVALPGVSFGQQVLLDGTAQATTRATTASGASVAVVSVGSGTHTVTTA
jgi:alpha-L-rhamnosidase